MWSFPARYELAFFSVILNGIACVAIYDLSNENTCRRSTLVETSDEETLFLTPMIDRGEIERAQSSAAVEPMLKNEQSFSGYLTVNFSMFSNMFFWYFKSQLGDAEAQPIVVWLQGGPGVSSLYGLLYENGPFGISRENQLKERKYSWSKKFNLVYLDNPVGTGFSFTKSEEGFANNEEDVARDLYEALIQFLKLFPAIQRNKLFITGESYAGKYIPAVAYKILKNNPTAPLKINLSGIFIGNAKTDPLHQIGYGRYLYQLGLIDRRDQRRLEELENEVGASIRAEKFDEALSEFNSELDLISARTGLLGLYDFVNDETVIADGPEILFLNDSETRRRLHVGNHSFNAQIDQTRVHLQNDRMQSVKPFLEEILTSEAFPVLFYSGQMDIIDAYPLSVEFYNALKWPYAKQYKSARRCQMKVGPKVAGYYKTAGTFTEVLLRNAGHMVPMSQPKLAFILLDKFVTNVSSFAC